MPTAFPAALDTLANPNPTDPRVGHASQHDNANDAIEALEAKVGTTNSAVTSSLDYLLKSSASVSPGHRHSGGDISALSLPGTAFDNEVRGGWIQLDQAPAYASATSVTLSGDYTGSIAVGSKIKLYQSSWQYFFVTACSFSAGSTTLTLKDGINSTTYFLTNSGISGYMVSSGTFPVGFPTNASWYDKCGLRLSGAPAFTAASGGSTAIPWAAEDYDTNGMHSNVTNNTRITVSNTAYYEVTAHVDMSPPAAAIGSPSIQLNRNASTVFTAPIPTPFSTTNYNPFRITQTISLVPGDYLELVINQFTGSSLVANAGSDNWMSVTQLP